MVGWSWARCLPVCLTCTESFTHLARTFVSLFREIKGEKFPPLTSDSVKSRVDDLTISSKLWRDASCTWQHTGGRGAEIKCQPLGKTSDRQYSAVNNDVVSSPAAVTCVYKVPNNKVRLEWLHLTVINAKTLFKLKIWHKNEAKLPNQSNAKQSPISPPISNPE